MRKLAAIMFTDIEGFTARMQLNEKQAIQLLQKHNEIYTQCIKLYKGHHIKYLGDGTLTIFLSAIEAVRCAIAFQQAVQIEIPIRIGIHQGDVILEKKDVLGDAVNLASRIQSCGVAGSILVSEKVHDEICNHDDISDVALGCFHLKNIAQPVNLYAIQAPGLNIPPTSAKGVYKKINNELPNKKSPAINFDLKRSTWLRILVAVIIVSLFSFWIILKNNNKNVDVSLKTIAVIPFVTIDSNQKNDVLAEGLTEEMISLLSANTELKIKKISSNAIGISNTNLQTLLKTVKAGSLLEGTVQHDKDDLFIFVTLRNVATNDVIWNKKYSEKFKDLMHVQEEVALKIANALNTNFSSSDIKNFVKDRTNDPDAYALYIEGRYALKKRDLQSIREAIVLFNKALAIDNNFALAYSGIGDAYTILIDNGYISYDSGANIIRTAVNKAFILDSSSAEIRASRAIFFSAIEGNHQAALKELQTSLELSPNYADGHQWYALELAADGQFDSALVHIDKAKELEPFSERMWANKGLILEFARRYSQAIKVLNYAIANFTNGVDLFYRYKTQCHYWLGQKDSVLYYAKFNNNDVENYDFWMAVCNNDSTQLKRQLNINKSGLDNETTATYYMFMHQPENAIKYIQDAYNKNEFNWLVYLNVSPVWDSLKSDAAFNSIVLKLGLKN